MSVSTLILFLFGPHLFVVKLHNMLYPAYISRHFKQFLQSFPSIHITGIPYNPQTQDIVKQTHHTSKLQIKKFLKGEYTGILLSSLSKADFTRFQHTF